MSEIEPPRLDHGALIATVVGALSCAIIILFAPSVAAIGILERFGLQITSICGLIAIGFFLGIAECE